MLPPHPGGGAISCSQLLVGFARLGHSVRALAPITAEVFRSGDVIAAGLPEIGLTRFLIPYFHSDPNVLPSDDYRRLEGKRIKEMLPVLMEKERPDIIIIGRGAFVLHIPDIARDYSVPCVLRNNGATTIGILNGTFPKALSKQLLKQYKKVDLIISPAKHLSESLKQLGFNNIKTILNAIDLHQFFPAPKDGALLQKLSIQKDDIIVVHASNMKSLKRTLDLVYSAKLSIRQNSKLVYVIVGDGPMRKKMEESCRKNQIYDRFKFVGWIDYERMPDYINLSDIVIMPSEGEGLAAVYLEAQACARLLLASDIPGAREVIVDGETGLLFHKGNIGDMTKKTLCVANDPLLREEVGNKARQRVKKYDLNHAVNAYLATFQGLVNQLRE